jgi:hypothetical protein
VEDAETLDEAFCSPEEEIWISHFLTKTCRKTFFLSLATDLIQDRNTQTKLVQSINNGHLTPERAANRPTLRGKSEQREWNGFKRV